MDRRGAFNFLWVVLIVIVLGVGLASLNYYKGGVQMAPCTKTASINLDEISNTKFNVEYYNGIVKDQYSFELRTITLSRGRTSVTLRNLATGVNLVFSRVGAVKDIANMRLMLSAADDAKGTASFIVSATPYAANCGVSYLTATLASGSQLCKKTSSINVDEMQNERFSVVFFNSADKKYENYYELKSISYSGGKTSATIRDIHSGVDYTFTEIGKTKDIGQLTFTLKAADDAAGTATIQIGFALYMEANTCDSSYVTTALVPVSGGTCLYKEASVVLNEAQEEADFAVFRVDIVNGVRSLSLLNAYALKSINSMGGKNEVILNNLFANGADLIFSEVGKTKDVGPLTFTLKAADDAKGTAEISVKDASNPNKLLEILSYSSATQLKAC